ncbi:hypothetical protein M758_10G086200 [Ceratodon purpureus]|nr:hypothetical protein M758_10G086200 [Ceratodon purpureus]
MLLHSSVHDLTTPSTSPPTTTPQIQKETPLLPRNPLQAQHMSFTLNQCTSEMIENATDVTSVAQDSELQELIQTSPKSHMELNEENKDFQMVRTVSATALQFRIEQSFDCELEKTMNDQTGSTQGEEFLPLS